MCPFHLCVHFILFRHKAVHCVVLQSFLFLYNQKYCLFHSLFWWFVLFSFFFFLLSLLSICSFVNIFKNQFWLLLATAFLFSVSFISAEIFYVALLLTLHVVCSSFSSVLRLNLFIFWLHWIFIVLCRCFSCSMWDLVPWSRIEPGPPCIWSAES